MANNKDFKVKNGIQPTVYHEGLGTVTSGSVAVGYDLSVAAYDNVSFSVNAQESAPSGISFKTDGTKMYVIGTNDDIVYQYSLSTAWDVSTASYDSVSFSVNSQEAAPQELFFKPDGTKLYVVGSINDTVYQYSLSTAWDVSTASYDSVSFSVASQDTTPVGLFFKSDGTKMYVSGNANDGIFQYSLSTAWDVSTASYDSVSLDVSSQVTVPNQSVFSDDGTKVFVADGSIPYSVYQYNLTTAWDLSSGSYANVSFDLSAQGESPRALFIGSDGTKMYTAGTTNDTVYQYSTGSTTTTANLDLSTGSVFEVTPTSDIQIGLSNPADSGTVSQATLLLDGAAGSTYDIANASYVANMNVGNELTSVNGMEISSDGTKIYAVGRTTDKVFEYVLSTPWDVTTGSYNSVEFSVLSQTTYPTDIAFKPDGTKMYICTSAEDKVFQYSLSTAWDLSTASYDSVSFDTSNEENNVQALAFSNDGTKMYTAGLEFDNVVEYDLSTAWDVSTASYNSVTLSTSTQTTTPDGLFFNADGTSLFLVSGGPDLVYQYDMTTAFDLSTASYTLASSSLNGSANTGKGGRFDNTGTRMYIVDDSADNVTQWTVGSAATITYDSTLQFGGGTAPDSPAIGETDVLTFSTRDGGTTYQAALSIDGAK